MKKYFIAAGIMLLAASCGKTQQTNNQNSQPAQQNHQATPDPSQTDWNSYASPAKYGFSIKYPKDFGFNTDYNQIKSLGYIPVCDQTTVGCVFYSGNEYKGTNFESAGVSVNVLSTLTTEAKCYNFNVSTNEAQAPAGDITINGTVFKSAIGGGAGAGHAMKTKVYRNFRNNLCYEIAQRVGSTNIGNYPEGAVKEFNQSEIWNKLEQVLNTFKFSSLNNNVSLLYCTDSPSVVSANHKVYPINDKYKNLEFLGQLFTAADCGQDRLNQVWSDQPVKGGNDVAGVRIFLKNKPSANLIKTFNDIGFACTDGNGQPNCYEWAIFKTVKVADMLKLEPYIKEFASDECFSCYKN